MLSARNKATFLLFLGSGLRLEELSKLQLEDIDLRRQRVVVRLGKMGKSRLTGTYGMAYSQKTIGQAAIWHRSNKSLFRAIGNKKGVIGLTSDSFYLSCYME